VGGFRTDAPNVMSRDGTYHDPLAAIADDHPEFVAERLGGLRAYFGDEEARGNTNCGALLAAVADVEPEAVRPAVETVLAAVREGSVDERPERALANLAHDHPALVAPFIDDLVRAVVADGLDSETSAVPRLSAQVSVAVEAAAPAAGTVEAATVESLANHGLGSADKQERLRAGRALGALACEGCLPGTESVANGVTKTLGDALEAGAIDPTYDHSAEGAAEPLAVLASDHTDFVATRLAGMAPAFRDADGTVWNKLETPLVEIAAADPVAIHPAVEWTIDAVERNTAIQRPGDRLVDIAETDPAAVAPYVDDLVGAAVRESPSSEEMEATLCSGPPMEAIEVAAPAIDSVHSESIAMIVEQGLGSPSDFERLYAARALGALAGENLIPEDAPTISAAADRLSVALERGELDSDRYRGTHGAEEPLALLASEHPRLVEYALEQVRERAELIDENTSNLERVISTADSATLD